MAAFLTGGLGLLPLAPLCELPAGAPIESAIADVVREIDRRLKAEATPEEAAVLMTGAYILTGARLDRDTIRRLFRGVTMEDSSSYQLILEEGGLRAARKMLLEIGNPRFGPPDVTSVATLNAIEDLDRLYRMAGAVHAANSWQELLNTP